MSLLDLTRTAAPAALLSLAEAKAHLAVEHDDDDALIAEYVATATDYLDGYGGVLGRALVSQTWRLWLAGFPCGAIALPLPPLISVSEILYVDPDGAEQTLTAVDDYVVIEGPLARIEPAYGLGWPSTRRQARAVRITFVAGHGAPEAVPGKARQLVRVMLADLYKNRESGVEGTISSELVGSARFQALVAALAVPRI